MNERDVSALVILASAFCPLPFAQNVSTVSSAGVREQVVQIEVTPADRAAVRPEGGYYPPRTFETDTSGALVEVTRNFPSPQSAGQSVLALVSRTRGAALRY